MGVTRGKGQHCIHVVVLGCQGTCRMLLCEIVFQMFYQNIPEDEEFDFVADSAARAVIVELKPACQPCFPAVNTNVAAALPAEFQ